MNEYDYFASDDTHESESECDRDRPEVICYRAPDRYPEGWMFRGETVAQWLFAPAHACIAFTEVE